MARYIGPKCKLARREGTDLFLKSARVLWILNVNWTPLLVSTAQKNRVCPTMVCNYVRSKDSSYLWRIGTSIPSLFCRSRST